MISERRDNIRAVDEILDWAPFGAPLVLDTKDSEEGELGVNFSPLLVDFQADNPDSFVDQLVKVAASHKGHIFGTSLVALSELASDLKVYAWALSEDQKKAFLSDVSVLDKNELVRSDLIRKDMCKKTVLLSFVTDGPVIFGANQSDLKAEIDETLEDVKFITTIVEESGV